VVKGLSQFGENKLAPAGHLGGDDAGRIAPIVFTDFDRGGGYRVRVRRGRRGIPRGRSVCPHIVLALAAQAAIGIALGVLVFVIAVFDVGFGVAEGL